MKPEISIEVSDDEVLRMLEEMRQELAKQVSEFIWGQPPHQVTDSVKQTGK